MEKSDKKECRFTLRMTKKEYAQLDYLAKKQGNTKSEIILQSIRNRYILEKK